MAIAAEGTRQRYYVAPTKHEKAADVLAPTTRQMQNFNTPVHRSPKIRHEQYSDLFTNRQLTALTTFSDLVNEARIALPATEQSQTTLMLLQHTWFRSQ